MTTPELRMLFERHSGELFHWDRAARRYSPRRDLNALMLLASLDPGTEELISWKDPENVWFSVSPEKVAENATEADVIELLRSGVDLHTEAFYLSV